MFGYALTWSLSLSNRCYRRNRYRGIQATTKSTSTKASWHVVMQSGRTRLQPWTVSVLDQVLTLAPPPGSRVVRWNCLALLFCTCSRAWREMCSGKRLVVIVVVRSRPLAYHWPLTVSDRHVVHWRQSNRIQRAWPLFSLSYKLFGHMQPSPWCDLPQSCWKVTKSTADSDSETIHSFWGSIPVGLLSQIAVDSFPDPRVVQHVNSKSNPRGQKRRPWPPQVFGRLSLLLPRFWRHG